MDRGKIIVRTSIIGIVTNVLLAAFKAAVGLLSHSVAVVLDAVNNLSDSLSSLITIIGTRLAAKEPDREHPLGYGRIEYLSASVVSVIVLYAGITSLVESVKKIIHPETPDYSPVALIIIAVAVVVKILLGTYVKRQGQKVDSDSLIASGSDALFDSIISASTLAAALIYLFTGLSLEAWLGAVISVVIIKSGFEMLRDTISEILGERVDSDVAERVRKSVLTFPEVHGVFDLVVHNYGPEKLLGSAHIEVAADMTARELDSLERQITEKVFADTGIIMTGISVYSRNAGDSRTEEAEKKVREILAGHPEVLQLHGFYMDPETHTMKYDIVISFDAADRMALLQEVQRETREAFAGWDVWITPDSDLSD